jgi:hypothetical protein
LKERLSFWANIIGVDVPDTYRIPRKDMVDLGENRRSYRFCGLSNDGRTIIYQGKLSDEDMVHELLHKKFPRLKEKTIRQICGIIISLYKTKTP